MLSTKANTPLLHHEGSLYSAENPFDIDSFYMGIVTLNKSSWSSYPVNEGAAPQEDMRGTLFAYRNDNGSGFFGSQVFTSLDNVAYIRNFWGNTMGSWKRIDNFGYNSLAELSAGVAKEVGVKKFMVYETENGGNITTNINVNQGYFGGTILSIANSHSSTGNATASEIKMIRCGYNGNHIEEDVISSLVSNANNGVSIASYSVDSNGYLVINVKVRIARVKLYLL